MKYLRNKLKFWNIASAEVKNFSVSKLKKCSNSKCKNMEKNIV